MSECILKISDAAVIAAHAMIELAKNPDKLLSVKEIAEILDVSANHLSKVMQRLCKAGLVKSIKGFNGGFSLCINPEELTFIEMYEMFDGKLKNAICLLHEKPCKPNCVFSRMLETINAEVKDKFKNTTLADLAKP